MDPEKIGRLIAEYLQDRDDVAHSDLISDPGADEVEVGVETQGGKEFYITVTKG